MLSYINTQIQTNIFTRDAEKDIILFFFLNETTDIKNWKFDFCVQDQ